MDLDLLLELAWWRQEYGDRGVSYATRLAMLQPVKPDRRIRSTPPPPVRIPVLNTIDSSYARARLSDD